MREHIGKIIGYIVMLILAIYIAVSVFIPEQTISIFGFRSFVVVSPSMEPTINVNDMIIVTKPKEDKLEERDIITFYVHIPEAGSKNYVTHYIGDIQTDGSGNTIYKTQGENKLDGDYDEWKNQDGEDIDISFEDIEGEYLFKIPKIGYVISMLQDPIFIILLVVNGTIIYFVVKLIKHPSKDENEEKEKEIT